MQITSWSGLEDLIAKYELYEGQLGSTRRYDTHCLRCGETKSFYDVLTVSDFATNHLHGKGLPALEIIVLE